MEVVIRTAHGGADVDITSWEDHTTLRDLLAAVTGTGVPPVVDVDGRPCRVDDTVNAVIERLGLCVGSVIDVAGDRRPDDPRSPIGRSSDEPSGDESPPLVQLRQLSGRGTGRVVDLPAGRFRFGAGRRLADGELVMSVVEEEAFTVTIGLPIPEPTDRSDPLAPSPPVLVTPPEHVAPVVTVRPGAHVAGELGPYTPMLGARSFDRELPWSGERLTVGARVFDLVPVTEPQDRHGEDPIGAARIGRPDADGIRSFDAAGSVAVLADGRTVPTEPVIAATARVDAPRRLLWRRLPNDDRLSVPIGLAADHRETVAVDLDRHGGIAVAGSNEFTAGVSRTILLELTTALGPGDLDVVVITSAGRLGRWDWCKWLPHVRGGDPTRRPQFLTTDDEVGAWCGSIAGDLDGAPSAPSHLHGLGAWGPPAQQGTVPPVGAGSLPPPTGRPHPRPSSDSQARRTLLVVDDAAQWTRRDSPLRDLLVDPHASIRVLATAERADDAPGACTAVVEEAPPHSLVGDDRPEGAGDTPAATRLFGSLCRMVERLGANPLVTSDVRPAIAELPTATHLARSMASLDDLRVRRIDEESMSRARPDRPTVADLVAASTAGGDGAVGVSTRQTVAIGSDLATGESDSTPADPDGRLGPAMIDLAVAGVTVIAVDRPDDESVLAALTLGMAVRHGVDELAILLVADTEPGWIEPLPHAIGTVDGRDAAQLGRVLRRVESALSTDREMELLVVVADAVATDGPPRLTDAAIAFLELASALDRVHLVLSAAAEHGPMVRRHLDSACGAALEGRADGTATLIRRDDGMHLGTARIMPTADVLLPVDATPPPAARSAGLLVRPFVFGRPVSPIERRLSRRASTPDPGHDAAPVDDRETTPSFEAVTGHRNRLFPPPFPEHVGQETLLGNSDQRDAGTLGLGIVERPDDGSIDVYRWTPRAGSLVAVGHRRSGTGVVGDLVAAAMTVVDADVWVLDPLPQRRRAFRRLPRCRATADPDSAATIERFLTDVERDVAQQRAQPASSDDALDVAEAVRGGPRPTIVVIGDLHRTLIHFDQAGRAEVLERLGALTRRAPDSPGLADNERQPVVALVVAAAHHREIAGLVEHAADVLVGALDEDDRGGLAVPDRAVPTGDDRTIAGRCWSTAHQRLVQLATPPDQLERFVRERASLGTEHDGQAGRLGSAPGTRGPAA